jgi:lantibiotic modifying enzyme
VPEFGHVAVSAISHALSRVSAIPERTRFGFFVGLTGIAYSASRIGVLMDRPDLVGRARRLLRRLAGESLTGTILDVIAGPAGSAPVIVSLARDWRDERLKRLGRRLGRRMVARAQKTSRGWSWGSDATGFESARHLTGFAHGAAGFGWSLMQLHLQLDDPLFERGALQAFRYERQWFRKDQDNWPDFRETSIARRAPCRKAWCHGAPGIGLSRLATVHAHGTLRYRTDVSAAARSSRSVLSNGLDHHDYSLCHGMLGIAEFLLMTAAMTGDKTSGNVARTFATLAADTYKDRPREWPCGLDGRLNPSLMLGLAGIGYFYLRSAFSDVPSVLLPGWRADEASRPDHFAATRLRPERAESTAH